MLRKQGIDISFAKGLDTKTDPKRLTIGNFLSLQNSVFDTGGQLKKRNGFKHIANPTLFSQTSRYSYLTTYNQNLVALGTSLIAYNKANDVWPNATASPIEPMNINTLAAVRNNLNQTAADSAVASNGLICTVYLESTGSSTSNKFLIQNSVTGQIVVAPTNIPDFSGTVAGGMRIFILGNFFIILYRCTITGTQHLRYIAISISDPTQITSPADIASQIVDSATVAWDGFVYSDKLYIAYNTTSGGQAVKITYLTTALVVASAKTFAGQIATMMSVAVDSTVRSAPVIRASYYDSAGSTGYTFSVDQNLNTILAPTQFISSGAYLNIISASQATFGGLRIYVEKQNDYPFTTAPAIPTHYIESFFVTSTGTVIGPDVTIRSVGLASKAFKLDQDSSIIYFLAAYQSSYQPSYFLVKSGSTESFPDAPMRLAYQNGGGYLTTGLPNVSVLDTIAFVPYRFKDLIEAVNKETNPPSGTQVGGIYSQTGINIASINFSTDYINTSEIGKTLNFGGGILWTHDGQYPTENNFLLYPDMDTANPAEAAIWSATGGSIAAKPDSVTNTKAYYYVVTYEWTDNTGNAYRSAPSVPIWVTTTGSGTSGSITLKIPTLRITYKVGTRPAKIVIYRWSVAQQNYYQVTSISSPTLNDTTVDYITYIDTSADATILGNNLLYTTGGVIENIAPPSFNLVTLFDNRLWLVDSEDQNLLWFSKQVIEATPVEMSDLLTMYVSPTTGSQGSTGPITAIAPLDDKLIIFKNNAIYYVNGSGPDNTGANNQYSQPIFVTSTVGCANQKSIVFMPQGLMFQSNKGIWLLDRGLNTSYIGAEVEEFNTAVVNSALNIPETNQVRFSLDTGVTLMYDYFYQQWGTFTGIPMVSSCIYDGVQTFIKDNADVFQENPGSYLDGSLPVLMQFTTGPIRLGELQNYQRAYTMFLLGSYKSPHKLYCTITYDYDQNPSQADLLVPDNYSTNYSDGLEQSPYGQQQQYGGMGHLEHFRIFLQRQRCMAVAFSVQEIFDPTLGVEAGAGLTLSGINVVCGFKGTWSTISSTKSYG